MLDNSIDKILNSRWFIKFKKTPSSRWLVLLADLLVVLFSFSLLAVSDFFATIGTTNALDITINFVAVVTVYGAVILIFKSHTSILRLSVLEDLFRELWVVIVATLVLLVAKFSVLKLLGYDSLRLMHVLIGGIISFSLLVLMRLFMKLLYNRIRQYKNDSYNVLVYGTSMNSFLLASALKNEVGGKYHPIGLLTNEDTPKIHDMNGFKVFGNNLSVLEQVCVDKNVHALIFSPKRGKIVSEKFADFFVKRNMKLLLFNSVQEFETHNEETKKVKVSSYVKEVQIEDLLGRDPIVLNNALVRSHVKDSVVLITGACGSIGSEIVRQLASYKAKKIILVDQAETPMHDLSLEMTKEHPDIDVVTFMGDVQNFHRMEEAFKTYKPEYVFHAAAYKHVPMMENNPSEAVLTNVMGTKNIADLSLKYGVRKFVMVSTDKAVNPTNIMGCTKRLAEIYTQSLFFDASRKGAKTQFITTRFGNVLGSNGSVIPLFRKQIAAGGPLTVTHRDIIRYFMTIPEACSLVLEAGCMGRGGTIYVFDMGEPVKIYDLAERMISLAGFRPNVDIMIEEVGLRPGEKLYEELLNDKEKTLDRTENEKIMVAKVRTYDFPTVIDNIDNIIQFADAGNVHDMVKAMKHFVPEFHSNMSEFEAIDKEIEKETAPDASVPETEVYY